MSLDKELKGTAGKEVGKEVARVTQDKDEAVELSKLGMIDKTPIRLRYLSGEESELRLGLRHLSTKLSRVLDDCRVSNLDSPFS